MRLGLTYLTCLGCLLLAPRASAQEYLGDDNTISVYAKACEPLRVGEVYSGARARATDKAGFHAIEAIGALSDKKGSLSSHDFNVLIYHIVDNYLEDMTVRTTEQNAKQVCVEVTGYLSPDNIVHAEKALNDSKQILIEEEERDETEAIEDEPYDEFLEIESALESLPEVVTQMPPKPQPKIHEEIAFSEDKVIPQEYPALENLDKVRVFVDKTKFFNGSESNGFFSDIEQALSENPNIVATQSKTDADYALQPTVLKAKVDPINQQTYRLQMVVQLELRNIETGTLIKEHQNRFVLFESDDDEQKTASSLMRKLLRKGCRQLLPKIKTNLPSSASKTNSVITPPQN